MSKTSVYLALVLFVFAFTACTLKQPQEPVSQSRTERRPNIAFELQYDEESTTYALHWPGQMVSGLAKSAETNELLLADYQNVHTRLTIDTSGYVSLTNENIEGNESVRMPQEVYDVVRDQLPAHDGDFDPVVKWELVAGQLTSFTQSGVLQTSVSMDQEQYRLDPELLDSLYNDFSGDTIDFQTRKKQVTTRLSRQGIAYNLVGDNGLVININGTPRQDGESNSTKLMLDLTTGLIIRSALFNENNQPLQFSTYQYKKAAGIPVIKYERTYTYGEVNGSWQAMYMSISDRRNINVYRNNY